MSSRSRRLDEFRRVEVRLFQYLVHKGIVVLVTQRNRPMRLILCVLVVSIVVLSAQCRLRPPSPIKFINAKSASFVLMIPFGNATGTGSLFYVAGAPGNNGVDLYQGSATVDQGSSGQIWVNISDDANGKAYIAGVFNGDGTCDPFNSSQAEEQPDPQCDPWQTTGGDGSTFYNQTCHSSVQGDDYDTYTLFAVRNSALGVAYYIEAGLSTQGMLVGLVQVTLKDSGKQPPPPKQFLPPSCGAAKPVVTMKRGAFSTLLNFLLGV